MSRIDWSAIPCVISGLVAGGLILRLLARFFDTPTLIVMAVGGLVIAAPTLWDTLRPHR